MSRNQSSGYFNPLRLAGIGVFIAFALVWVFGIVPYISTQSWFYDLPPVEAYPIYNLGFIILSIGFFDFLLSVLMHRHFTLVKALVVGIGGWLSISLVFDMLQPPFYLGVGGTVLIPLDSNALENTAVDAMAAQIWMTIAPWSQNAHILGASWLFIFVYLVTPILAITISAFLLAPKVFLKTLMVSGGQR